MKQPQKKPAEVIWADYLSKSNEFAIEVNEEDQFIIYNYNKNLRHWQVLTDNGLNSYIWKFLETQKPIYQNARDLADCCKITTFKLANCAKRIIKNNDILINTRNHILKLIDKGEEKGRIQVIHKDNLQYQGKEYYTNIYVDVDLSSKIVPAMNYYTPEKNEKIESKDTLFSYLLNSGLPNEFNRRVAQEFLGDTLNPTLRKAFTILIGPANGGKSQFLELIKNVHGKGAFGGNLSNLSGFALEPYIGKSLIIYDEFDKKINDNDFKRLVGGTVVNIERKYQKSISIKPDFKMIGCCNDLPTFSDKSGAVETRIYPIYIEANKSGKKIDELAKKIWEQDKEDVLDWLLNGAISVILRGRILRQEEMSEESIEISEKLKRTINPILNFFDDLEVDYTFDSGFYTSKDEIYKQFKIWAENNGHNFLKDTSASVFFRNLFLPVFKERFAEYNETQDKKKTFYIGSETKRIMAMPLKMRNGLNIKQVEQEKEIDTLKNKIVNIKDIEVKKENQEKKINNTFLTFEKSKEIEQEVKKNEPVELDQDFINFLTNDDEDFKQWN